MKIIKAFLVSALIACALTLFLSSDTHAQTPEDYTAAWNLRYLYDNYDLTYQFDALDAGSTYDFQITQFNPLTGENGAVLTDWVIGPGVTGSTRSYDSPSLQNPVWVRVIDNFGNVIGEHAIMPDIMGDGEFGLGWQEDQLQADADEKLLIADNPAFMEFPIQSGLRTIQFHDRVNPEMHSTALGDIVYVHFRADATGASNNPTNLSDHMVVDQLSGTGHIDESMQSVVLSITDSGYDWGMSAGEVGTEAFNSFIAFSTACPADSLSFPIKLCYGENEIGVWRYWREDSLGTKTADGESIWLVVESEDDISNLHDRTLRQIDDIEIEASSACSVQKTRLPQAGTQTLEMRQSAFLADNFSQSLYLDEDPAATINLTPTAGLSEVSWTVSTQAKLSEATLWVFQDTGTAATFSGWGQNSDYEFEAECGPPYFIVESEETSLWGNIEGLMGDNDDPLTILVGFSFFMFFAFVSLYTIGVRNGGGFVAIFVVGLIALVALPFLPGWLDTLIGALALIIAVFGTRRSVGNEG